MTEVYLTPEGRLMLEDEIQKLEDFSSMLYPCLELGYPELMQDSLRDAEVPEAPELVAQSGLNCHSELYGEPVYSHDLPPGSFIVRWNGQLYRVKAELVNE